MLQEIVQPEMESPTGQGTTVMLQGGIERQPGDQGPVGPPSLDLQRIKASEPSTFSDINHICFHFHEIYTTTMMS